MALEETLAGWTGPSSDTEQAKQERTERMVQDAIAAHKSFESYNIRVFAKGSYANNTNVRADSDVDIAVECAEALYWDEREPGLHKPTGVYEGIWTPEKLRKELTAALQATFDDDVDDSGSTAIRIHSNSARIDADVVPCFTYRYHTGADSCRDGNKIFKRDNTALVNYPDQQLKMGRAKNVDTGLVYKKVVRIFKRIENALAHRGATVLPSYFIECLVFNCPNEVFAEASWTQRVRAALVHFWNALEGPEPIEESARWREANGCVYLFHNKQPWDRTKGRAFVQGAWNYLGLK